MKNNAKLNYIYNLAFQIFALITPLITTPYVARKLSPVGVGQFAFASSVNSYFCMFAALGFSLYAQREIAKKQGNKIDQSIVFWEIMICKIITGLLVLLVYWVSIYLGVFGDFSLLIKIMSIGIISSTFDIAFYFQGNEEFRLIAIRDLLVRVLGIIFIFVFVKKPSDLWIYALCNIGTSMISVITLWICIKSRIVLVNLKNLKPIRHFRPSVRLFIPTIAISIYTILDKTLIGILIPGSVEQVFADGTRAMVRIADIENGYYAQSEKIIKMSMTVLASLGTVMMPRNAKELADGREDVFLKNINKAIQYVFFIGALLWAGLTAIAFNFSPWFFGEGYEKVPYLMIFFSIMIIPAGLGNVLGQQYLIPKGEDKKYVIVYVMSAIVNFLLNLVLIPSFLSYGAALASIIAETLAPIIMLIYLRNKISFGEIIKKNYKSLISAIGMFMVVYITSKFLRPVMWSTFALIVEGVVIYLLLSFCLRVPIMLYVMELLQRRIRGKKDEYKN